MPEVTDTHELSPAIPIISEDRRILNWENDLRRLVRRAEIYKQLEFGLPLREIKDAVREHEKS